MSSNDNNNNQQQSNNDDDSSIPPSSSANTQLPNHSSSSTSSASKASSSIPRPPPNETTEQWVSRVRSAQMSVPEKRAELLQRQERSATMRKKAKEWTGHQHRSVHAKNSSYVALTSSSAAPPAPGAAAPITRGYQMASMSAAFDRASGAGGGGSAPPVSRPQQALALMDQLDSDDQAIQASFAPVPQQQQQKYEAMEEEEAMESANIAGHAAVVAASRHAEAVTESEQAAALRQLAVEPNNDAEREAKFEIFSKFSDKVSTLKKDFDSLMANTVSEMPQAVRDGVQRSVRQQLECDRARGIYDDSTKWFVHDMLVTTTRNADAMTGLSDEVSRKMRLLANDTDTDCPVCLLPYEQDGPNKKLVLSCVHSVCAVCWAKIVELKGPNAACCLCRQEVLAEIIEE